MGAARPGLVQMSWGGASKKFCPNSLTFLLAFSTLEKISSLDNISSVSLFFLFSTRGHWIEILAFSLFLGPLLRRCYLRLGRSPHPAQRPPRPRPFCVLLEGKRLAQPVQTKEKKIPSLNPSAPKGNGKLLLSELGDNRYVSGGSVKLTNGALDQ